MTANDTPANQPVDGQPAGERLPAPDLDKVILNSIEGQMGSMQDRPTNAHTELNARDYRYPYAYSQIEPPLSMNQGEPDEETKVKAREILRQIWLASRRAGLVDTPHVAFRDVVSPDSETSIHAFEEIVRKHMDESEGLVVWFGGDVASDGSVKDGGTE